jgi:DNA recombination protein RmuC
MGTLATALLAGLVLLCLGLGALLLQALRRNAGLTADRDTTLGDKARLEGQLAAEQAQSRARLEAAGQAQEQARNAFEALAVKALQSNNEQFLALAKQNLEKLQQQGKGDLELKEKAVEALVKPIRESLQQVNLQVQELEKARAQAYGSLTEQLKSLQSTTGSLASALRRTETRGRWGELQLRNVLEAAGLRAGLDYVEQVSVTTGDGRLRPDVIVKLPDGGSIVIDAKAPLDAFLRGHDAPNEEARQVAVKDHVRLVKTHIAQLSGKEYWSQFAPSPEFVIMFLPGEAFFIAALEQEPELIQNSVEQRVVLASPITLIALLRAVSYGWRQKRVEEQAQAIAELGATLYQRLGILAEHFGKVGDHIDRAAKAYNAAVGTLERNVLSAARRFPELGTPVQREIPPLEPVDSTVRPIDSRELLKGVAGTKG